MSPMPMKVPTEEIVAAYRETGSVWRTAQRVGLCGQSVWERLRAIGHPLRGQKWTAEERERLREMVGHFTLTQLAYELGRPYGSVATKISEMGLAGRSRRRGPQKLPRGGGFDKATTLKRIRELEKFDGSVRQYARARGIHLDPFIKAVQKHALDWWNAYVRTQSDLPAAQCEYCEGEFYPMTKKQRTCSRRCSSHLRADRSYFGGKRKLAIGMAEGVCQLCSQSKKTLAAHHILGKENDPENDALIALCNGCHREVGTLAGRKFTETAEGWEALINLVMLRRMGGRDDLGGVHTLVEIDVLTPEEVAEDVADETEPERVVIVVRELP